MKRKALFTLILGTVLAVAPAAGAKVITDGGTGTGSGPAATMSQPEYQALMIRSAALNKLYGNAVTALTPQQFKSLYDAGLNRMTPQEQIAVVARSEGLNRAYGGGGNGNVVATQGPSAATDADSFAWDAAYGAIALTGAMLLALGFAVVSRRRHHHEPSF
jgi:hypothetical protein